MKITDRYIRKALGNGGGFSPKGDESDENTAPEVNTIILEEFITRYSPAEKYGPGVIIRSTADIIAELSDMADLAPDEVNAFLIRHKYRPGRNNSGSFGWLMSYTAD